MSFLAPHEPFTPAIAVNVKSVQGVLFGLTLIVGKNRFVLNGEVTTFVRVSNNDQSVTSTFFVQSAETLSMANLKGFQILSLYDPGH